MAFNSQAFIEELAAVSGLPAYKVRRMMMQASRLIHDECKRGGWVAVPMLGRFEGKTMRAKTIKNAIAGTTETGIARQVINMPQRRKLVFTPKDARKWL